jgi:hypothetical protein
MEQVEAELHRSNLHSKVSANLQSLPDEISQQMQQMVNAIGREAIRLAFRRMMRQKIVKATPTIAEPLANGVQKPERASLHLVPPPPPANPNPAIANPVPLPNSAHAIAPQANLAAKKVPPAPRSHYHLPQKRLTKKERLAQVSLQAWQESLQALGQEIRQLRQAKFLSPQQLHFRTQIPLHQLEALETGQIERLPEDVYIRGFLRRIEQALELEDDRLSHALPLLDPVKAILPTWSCAPLQTGVQLSPIHLYLGYAAILAGGFTWITQQSTLPQATLPSPTPPVDAPSQRPANPIQENNAAKKSEVKVKPPTPAAIAPPER